jgi:predicted N-formylglutamate amidohydrolase
MPRRTWPVRQHPGRGRRIALRGAATQAFAGAGRDRPRATQMARLVVTCEHGGNRIPQCYSALFAGRYGIVASHRGFDVGALALARELARSFGAPLHYSLTSRLLVDLNRSIGHAELHSAWSAAAPEPDRAGMLQRFYIPYRRAVEAQVERWVDAGEQVVHVSCHSFTPLMQGRMRYTDIGLLFDPGRPREAALCRQWRKALHRICPTLRIRMNAPYHGASDGFTTALRQRLGAAHYLGVEIEVNQRLTGRRRGGTNRWWRLRRALAAAIAA